MFSVPNTETFVCLRDQVSKSLLMHHFIFIFPSFPLMTDFRTLMRPILTPGRSLPASICESLSDRPIHSGPISSDEQRKVHIQTKMNYNLYVALSLLEDPHLEAMMRRDEIAWDGARGWLDEMEKGARRRIFEEGWE